MSTIQIQLFSYGKQRECLGGNRMEAISIGLLGLGTVGSGVIQIIENHQDKLLHQIGCPIKVKKVLVQSINKK